MDNAQDTAQNFQYYLKIVNSILREIPTHILVDELARRESVERNDVLEYVSEKIPVVGPAVVLIVTD